MNPAQAVASVGKRGWVNVPEGGLRRTFHREGLSAWVTFLQGWFTPTEVDGLTVEHVVFTSRADGKPIELEKLNPRLFSEAMRDLDLMVSVVHRGGVDPETNLSTIEMRAALVRETAHQCAPRLSPCVHQRNSWRLQRPSRQRDGTSSARREPLHCAGRLTTARTYFLPFADDDPKQPR